MTIDVPLRLFETWRSNETQYLEANGIIMSSFDPELFRDQAVIWEQALKRVHTLKQTPVTHACFSIIKGFVLQLPFILHDPIPPKQFFSGIICWVIAKLCLYKTSLQKLGLYQEDNNVIHLSHIRG